MSNEITPIHENALILNNLFHIVIQIINIGILLSEEIYDM